MEPREYGVMRAVEDSHWWFRSLRSLAVDRVASANRILDAGCGTGGMLNLLRGRRAIGIDPADAALAHCRGRGLTGIVQGSICALPFPGESFDAVLALDVLYHAGVGNDETAMAEVARVLCPGGAALLHLPAYRWMSSRHDRATHGARRYTTDGVRRLVEATGMAIVELSYRNLAALPIAAIVRRPWRRNRNTPGFEQPGSDVCPLPWAMNAGAALVSRVENALLNRHLRLPVGLSVWCVARKPALRGAA